MSMVQTISKAIGIGGIIFNEHSTVYGDCIVAQEVSVSGAIPGIMSLRSSDTDCTITVGTLATGLVLGNVVDLYWNGGCRRRMSIGDVDGLEIALVDGDGDTLPEEDVTIVISKSVFSNVSILGSTIKSITVHSEKWGQISFFNDSNQEIYSREIGSNKIWNWESENGEPNPINPNERVTLITVSHSNTDDAVMKFGILYNNE